MIELQPRISVERAIGQLQSALDGTQTVTNATAGATGPQVVENYARWAEDSERTLTKILTPDSLSDLIHTRRHWALRAVTGDEPRLIPLVLTEIESRQNALTAMINELQLERQRWSSAVEQPYTIAVPDSTMFLDPEAAFEDIDWRVTTESRQGVRVVVPLAVVDELDRLKRQGNSTTARLAKAAIRWLSSTLPRDTDSRAALSGDGIETVTIEVYVEDGPRRLDDADLSIIRSTERLGSVSGALATLVTRDLGMAVRARAVKVPVVHIPPPTTPSTPDGR
jgi:rRNA-processing protein FCF1